ncbi:MAG TPA: proline dehydrogenase family protein [Mycobacteriales bacterium]|jgi:proline dehydrogenase|nr:proline dehydrogenase family protein [Mycobacteriales bacterium]
MLRSAILAAAESKRIERFVSAAPLTSGVVRRFVAGTAAESAVAAARELHLDGYNTTMDYLGEDVADAEGVSLVVTAYRTLLTGLADSDATAFSEVSVKLSALGQGFDRHRALAAAAEICETANAVGTTVTIDAEEYHSIDGTLEAVAALRRDYPDTGAVLQAYLRRTEADCRDLAGLGSRIRLCKGAYAAPESVAYQQRHEVNRSYVRCLNVLLAGAGRPMVATHDPLLITIAVERAYSYRRDPHSYEFQMLFGAHPRQRQELLTAGHSVRIYVPYGVAWYRYLMRRMAERPANLAFFLRALAS